MSKSRKTVEVAKVVEAANAMLAYVNPEELLFDGRNRRTGVMAMVESVLHAANAYGGFGYLPSEFVEDTRGERVLREYYDRTRVQYTVRTW